MTTLLMLIFLLIAMAGGVILGWLAHARQTGAEEAEPVDWDSTRFAESSSKTGD